MTIDKVQAEPWNNLKMSQRVLVAAYNTEIRGKYTRRGKPLWEEEGICGGDVTLDDGSQLVGENHCTKTRFFTILNSQTKYFRRYDLRNFLI